MKDLVGKTAFITGAASGIGLGIATALAQAGAKVMLCDLREDAARTAAEHLRHTNADVDSVRADVSLKSELEAAAEATLARFGKVHMVINNAGVGGGGRWTDNNWNWVLGVNLMSVIWGFELFIPLLESHGEGGQIVSTASISGLVAGGGSPPYDVSKYGVVALSEALRPSLARRGIGVSVLCPGYVRTNFARLARAYVPQRISAAAAPQQSQDSIHRLVSAAELESIEETIARVDNGIDPLHVGELVREGIENDWPYIFTDTEFESAIEARFAEIRRGFDRIRSRTPTVCRRDDPTT